MKPLLAIIASLLVFAGFAQAACQACGCKAKCSDTCKCPQKKTDA